MGPHSFYLLDPKQGGTNLQITERKKLTPHLKTNFPKIKKNHEIGNNCYFISNFQINVEQLHSLFFVVFRLQQSLYKEFF